MSIIQIKNPIVRRSVLIIATIPLAVFAPLYGAILGAWEAISDLSGAWRNAWRGR